MEMLPIDPRLLAEQPVRPLKRAEYERLASEGYFEAERVELLFGVVVEMTPIDPAHGESTYRVRRYLERALGDRAKVFSQSPFAASDVSEPEPDVFVIPNGDYWNEHPTTAYLVVEVARSSLRRDRGIKAPLYGLSQVDEYWIVNHVDGVVEVYRDRHQGQWRSTSTYERGETIAMLRFPDVSIPVSEILPPSGV
jgi:Uma2 family endonuclease